MTDARAVTSDEAALVRKVLATTGYAAPMHERHEARRIVDRFLPSMSGTGQGRARYGVKIARGVITQWKGEPITSSSMAAECAGVIEEWTGERGEIEALTS